LALVFINKNDYKMAITLLESAIKKLNKQNKVKKELLSNCYRYLATALRYSGKHENAKTNILKALELSKNKYKYYCEYAQILFCLDKVEEAEDYFTKALEAYTTKEGSTHPSTASIMFHYGCFLASLGRFNEAKENMNNACLILKETFGETNLYSIRVSGHIANLLYAEKKYSEALKLMELAFINTKNILGVTNKETLTCKNNCARILIKMKKYSDVPDYIDNPFVLIDKKKTIFIFLAYNANIMIAPEIYLAKTGASAEKILKVIEKKNIPIIEHKLLAKALFNDCEQFKPIPSMYYNSVATVLKNILC